MATRYKWDKQDGKNAIKVAAYSGLAAFIGSIIVAIGNFDIPSQYLFLVPLINTGLVSLKDFLENRAE